MPPGIGSTHTTQFVCVIAMTSVVGSNTFSVTGGFGSTIDVSGVR